ncbi:3-oxoacyl-[acyl-carrier protein] reductase reductase (fabG, OAR1) [Diplonema papillatum]|nr:3-oxoacyl-[acyl-carrier protein] reductase reductase (fabG, OAR1) [Diplonema papillatum]
MLKGKTALITGASKGIGRAIAEVYAKEGAKLIITARSTAALKEFKEKHSSAEVICETCDFTDMKAVSALADKVVKEHGGVDILVNNAGMAAFGNAETGDVEEWDKMLLLNLHAPLRLTRLLTGKMIAQKSGVIINIGSVAGVEAMSGAGAVYAAAKHGISGWTRSIYMSMRLHNVKVMLICPGLVNTDFAETPNLLPERMIQAEDIAEVCLLPFKLSSGCVPCEVVLRLALPANKDS